MTKSQVTVADIQGKVRSTTYTVLPDGRTTVCQITLENGFTVLGKSACVNVANYNQALGEKYAFEDASNKIWELEGYLLMEQRYQEARGDTNQHRDDQESARRDLLLDIHNALGCDIGEDVLKAVSDLKAGILKTGVFGVDQELIAEVCHEVNKAYCEALGDTSQPAWKDAPEWQRESARMGVDLHLMGDFGPEASHISWMKHKLDEGWAYGPVKDSVMKTHPCLVPFDQLPREQQAKDYIFRAVVHALKVMRFVVTRGGDPVGLQERQETA